MALFDGVQGLGIIGQTGKNRKRRSYTSLGKGQRIKKKYPALAIAFFLSSIAFALGHHFYYRSKDGHLAESTDSNEGGILLGYLDGNSATVQQVWALRWGNLFAFLHKSALQAIFAMVATQQVWSTLRRKSMTVHGIDAMFSIMNNFESFFDKDLLAHAKLLVLLAVVSWTWPPIVAVLTPPTLSVITKPMSTIVQTTVPTVNYSDFGLWYQADYYGYTLGASPEVASLFTRTYATSSFVPMSAPYINASYEQTFYGPSYRCVSLNQAINEGFPNTSQIISHWPDLQSIFIHELGFTDLNDTDSLIFNAVAPNYLNNTILVTANGTNPLWDGSTTNATTADNADAIALSRNSSSNIVCRMYNTSFHVSIQFENGQQSIVPLAIDYLELQGWSDIGADGATADWEHDSSSMPEYIRDVVATFYITHVLFTYLLGTKITMIQNGVPGGEVLFGDKQILAVVPFIQSQLLHCPDVYNSSAYLDSGMINTSNQQHYQPQPGLCRNGTLAAAIEDLSRNFTYSMLTFQAWANYTLPVAMNVTQSRVFFSYNWHPLAVTYAVSVLFGLIALVIGALALHANGVVGGVSFSTALLTTRNPELDLLVRETKEGGSLPMTPMTPYDSPQVPQSGLTSPNPGEETLAKARLRFGHISLTTGGAGHTGFGLDGSIDPL